MASDLARLCEVKLAEVHIDATAPVGLLVTDVDPAKGLLMNSRRLSEADAYALMRETAMSQNKRIFEIAESIVSMAEILKR